MSKQNFHRYLRNYLILAGYLVFFVLGPWGIGSILYQYGIEIAGYIGIFLIFVSPFLFIIPYKLAKLNSKREKLLYFLLGFVIPFALFYYYLYLDYKANFHPGF